MAIKISTLYREIANNPKYKDDIELKKVTKKLLNRARVRIQTIENKGAMSSGYLKAKERLKNAKLLTAGGNVSLKLEAGRDKILTVLRSITNFLDVADTTLRGQKRRQRAAAKKKKKKTKNAKKNREKKRLKEKKEAQKVTEDTGEEDTGEEDTGEEDTGEEDTGEEDTGEEDTGEDTEEDTGEDSDYFDDEFFENNDIGDYWAIASEYGLFTKYKYSEIERLIITAYINKMSLEDFERMIIDIMDKNTEFFDTMKNKFGIDV